MKERGREGKEGKGEDGWFDPPLLNTFRGPCLTLSDPRCGVLTPTDPRTAENKGCLSGEFWSETAGDNRRQQNRIYTVIEFYALVNLKPQ